MRRQYSESSSVASDVKLNRSSTLRHLILILIASVLFVIVIAWSCAWLSGDAVRGHHISSGPIESQLTWIRATPGSWPNEPLGITYAVPSSKKPIDIHRHARVRIRQGMHYGLSVSGGVMNFAGSDTDPAHAIDVILSGWPVHVFQQRGPDDTRPVGTSKLAQLCAHGIPVPEFKPLGLKAGRSLPLQPIWGPFLLSVLAFCIVLELAYRACKLPGKLKLNRRIRNRQCTQCGYQLNDLEQCPECGTQRA